MSAFDLSLLSLYRINGQEWPQLPGLLAQNPPKKTARGRDQDRLIVYLTLAGNVMYSSVEYTQIVGQVAETFYDTTGSLTFALKTATEALNTFLAERNMSSTSKGQYSIGALVLGALRGNLLYMVQCGPTHVFTLGSEPRHLNDTTLAGKGLGLSQTTRMYFAQAQLNPGDRLLFCAALPPNWEKTISEGSGPASLEVTRRRLMAANDGNVSALLIQASAGTGQFNLLKPVMAEPIRAAVTPPAPLPAPKPASPAPSSSGLPADALPLIAQVPPPGAPAASAPLYVPPPATFKAEPAPATEASPRAGVEPAPQPAAATAAPPTPVPTIPKKAEPEYSPEPKMLVTPDQKERWRAGTRATARFLAKAIQRGRAGGHNFVAWLEKFIPRLLPERKGQAGPSLTRSWPVFMAVFVPVVTIVMAMIVYENRGKRVQYETYFNNAGDAVQQTQNQADPTILRKHWSDALYWLDRADEFKGQETEASQKIRQQAQEALDALDRVARVDFKPALTVTLSRSLQVTHLAASDTDIYLLDAARGEVLRGAFNGRNYDLDTTFQCGPGPVDGLQVGQLIDLVALPRTNPSEATLLAVDASGNLLYCRPGAAPRAAYLQMPDTGWSGITAVAYDANNLYVLDAPARAVWVYFGDVSIKFPNKPYYFFESQIPLTLEEALGIAVNGDDLYLLYRDGHMTTCTLSRLSTAPTRCNDPAIFVETRPGFQGGIRLTDGKFTQIAFTSPPDPSVVLLQPYTQSVFRFSARALELQKELRDLARKDTPLPAGQLVTAMAFSPNKSLFIFVDGQLYFAVNVP